MDLSRNLIELICRNYKKLVDLKVNYSINYNCNDIIWICKNLKDLKHLNFEFPMDGAWDPALFNINEDLVLPNIRKADFKFLDLASSISILETVTKFMPNLTKVRISIEESDIPAAFFFTISEILITQLAKLKSLDFDGDGWNQKMLQNKSFLLHVQTNLAKFNKNPGEFKLV